MVIIDTRSWHLQWVDAVEGRKKHIRVINVFQPYGYRMLFKYALGFDAVVEQRGFKWDNEGKYFYCIIEDFLQQVLDSDGNLLEEADINIDLVCEVVANAEMPSDYC